MDGEGPDGPDEHGREGRLPDMEGAMKFGFVRRGYSGSGGAEAYLKRLAEALVQAGHSCVLFGSETWKEWEGEMVLVDGSSPVGFAKALQTLRPRERCDFLFSLERVPECDCFRAGDGVHKAWLERRAKFEPFWKVWFRGLRSQHRQLLELERRVFSEAGAGRVIANSEMVKSEIVANFDYPAERIKVVYNGVPRRELPERAEARARFGLKEGTLAVVFVGSGWERKGLRFAIEAVDRAKLNNIKLLVAGRGNQRAYGGSERVQFLGPVQGTEALLAAADLFLLPTLYDPFSNASLEAVAAGVPVLTTKDNGVSEIIASGSQGEVFGGAEEVDAMAAALEKWADPGLRERARPELVALGRRYSMEANLEATLAAISGSRKGSR